jgi:hypothetical protein
VDGVYTPSQSDKLNAYHRGIPGIVISRAGIYSYGPEERRNLKNPKGYPPPVAPPGGVPPEKLEHRAPLPWVVKNQWPEGTSHVAGLSEDADEDMDEDDTDTDDTSQDEEIEVIELDWSDEGVVYGTHVKDV